MSVPNNFNPFKEPYQPVQFVIILTLVFFSFPVWILYATKDGGEALRDWVAAMKDVPKALKDTRTRRSHHGR